MLFDVSKLNLAVQAFFLYAAEMSVPLLLQLALQFGYTIDERLPLERSLRLASSRFADLSLLPTVNAITQLSFLLLLTRQYRLHELFLFTVHGANALLVHLVGVLHSVVRGHLRLQPRIRYGSARLTRYFGYLVPSVGRLDFCVSQLNSKIVSSSKHATVQMQVLLDVLYMHVKTITSRCTCTG